MASRNKPHAGSLGYKPMKRAKRQTPRVRSWPKSKEAGVLGFAGYKAGMTNVIAVDHRKHSITSGMEIFIPVTVIETPPMVVAAIRAYRHGYLGEEALCEAWEKDLSKDLARRLTLAEKYDPSAALKKMEEKLSALTSVRLVVHTQPRMTSMSKKAPDLLEIGLGGTAQEQFELAKGLLGKEIKVEDVVNPHTFVDVLGVTKGKGFEGAVRRHGIKIQPRKAGKGRRHIGTGGAWTPSRKLWVHPLPGQIGYQKRTEQNKAVVQVGKDPAAVNPAGGFLHYGPVNSSYVLLKGSVPGPAKRLIRIVRPKRPGKEPVFEITHVNLSSKQGA